MPCYLTMLMDVGFYLDKLITRLDNAQDYPPASSHEWFMSSTWGYGTKSSRSLLVVSTLKVASEGRPYSAKSRIIFDEERCSLEKGTIIYLSDGNGESDSSNHQQQQRLEALASKVPGSKRVGPEIVPEER